MSKRHGATSLIQYREMGYLPQALFNFLALLGWAPEGENEILTRAEIIAGFNLDKVSKSPAVFDLDKLNWLNQQYIKKLDIEELKAQLKPYITRSRFAQQIENLDDNQYQVLVEAVRDRLICLTDIEKQAEVFFDVPQYEADAIKILKQDGVKRLLTAFMENYPDGSDKGEIRQYIKELTKKLGLKPRHVFMPLRCALTGNTHGPDLPYLINIWGKEQTFKRIEMAIELINKNKL